MHERKDFCFGPPPPSSKKIPSIRRHQFKKAGFEGNAVFFCVLYIEQEKWEFVGSFTLNVWGCTTVLAPLPLGKRQAKCNRDILFICVYLWIAWFFINLNLFNTTIPPFSLSLHNIPPSSSLSLQTILPLSLSQ